MQLDLDWNKDFQEFQEVLNCGINPEWLYCAKANMILELHTLEKVNSF